MFKRVRGAEPDCLCDSISLPAQARDMVRVRLVSLGIHMGPSFSLREPAWKKGRGELENQPKKLYIALDLKGSLRQERRKMPLRGNLKRRTDNSDNMNVTSKHEKYCTSRSH